MTERKSLESERAELVALDPLEMLLDAARFAEGNSIGWSNPEWAKAARSVVESARLAAQDQKPVAWHPANDVPNVARGASNQYIIAVYRKHSGKVYSFAAEYLNAYPLRYEYGCPKGKSGFCEECSEDGCPTTGWHVVEGAEDDGYTYHSLTLDAGDEIKGWRDVPQWGEDLSSPPAAGWDEAIEAAADLARNFNAATQAIVETILALRQNVPPDTGAGKSEGLELAHAGTACEASRSATGDLSRSNTQVDACPSDYKAALPPHGGADAGVREMTLPVSEIIDEMAKRWIEEKWDKAFREHCERLVGAAETNASAVLQNDLAEMLRALGMSDAAQPKSPHEVFQSAIAEMKRQIANASAEARFEFDRYINGQLMAEGVEITREKDLEAACRMAARIANKGPNGEAPVLVLKGSLYNASALREALILAEDVLSRWPFSTGIWPNGMHPHIGISKIREALSAHPHASDCDKHDIGPVQHWAVNIHVNGVQVLNIESECLSGIPNIDDYADVVRNCANHLLSFIGDEIAESASDCDKQGEAKCPECGGSGSIEIDDGHFIKCKCAPSGRTADVTAKDIYHEAATQLDALQARVKELENAVEQQGLMLGNMRWECNQANARALRAEQERDEAYERLKPFAKGWWSHQNQKVKISAIFNHNPFDERVLCTVGEMQAAYSFVRRLAGPEKEKS